MGTCDDGADICNLSDLLAAITIVTTLQSFLMVVL